MTKAQEQLAKDHGTPEQFEQAVWNAYANLMIAYDEANAAIMRYRAEWAAAAS